MTSPLKTSRGFSLLEVLIAVAIVSFGLLALAALQLSLVRASAAAKTQTTATALAKEKIEQLRSFQTPAEYLAITSEGAAAITQGGVNFSRTTTVVRYLYSTATGAYVASANTTGALQNRDLKRVVVNVAWTDSSGTTPTVSMEDVIDGLDPADSARLVKFASAGGPRKLQEKIGNPALADSMVIPIALGGGVSSAATNPKPNVVKGVNTVETSFDVLTYAGLTTDTAVTAQAKVETLIDGCTCDYAAAPASTTRGLRPTYWDGTRYTVPLDVASSPAGYSPPAGVASAFVAQQSAKCTICCRDHHDPVGTTGATFSPTLVTKVNGVVTVRHPHFFDKAALAPTTTGTYKEACRVIRVDGIWSVAADLSNDYFAMLATGDGTTALTPVPDSTSVQGTPPVPGGAFARYQKFVLGYMGARFTNPTPSAGTEQATYNSVGTPYVLAASAPYVLDNPTSISITLVDLIGKWLHSRGLYVDYLEKEAVDAITAAKADSTCNASSSALSLCVLKLLPFTSINLTEIADWSPPSGPLVVTNNDYSQSTLAPLPVRGKVTTNTASGATINAVTNARKTNSGLLDLSFDAISPADNVTIADTQSFLIGGGPPPPPGPGNGTFYANLTMPTGFVGTPNVSHVTGVKPSVSCSPGAPVTNQTCAVQDGSALAGLNVDSTMAIIVGGYNTAVQGSDTTPLAAKCTFGGPGTGPTPINSSGSYTINTCRDYSIASALNVTQGQAAVTPFVVSNAGLAAESTKIGFTKLNNGDTVTVTFNTTATTTIVKRPATCTFTCDTGIQGTGCKANKITFQFPAPPACP